MDVKQDAKGFGMVTAHYQTHTSQGKTGLTVPRLLFNARTQSVQAFHPASTRSTLLAPRICSDACSNHDSRSILIASRL